MRACPANCKKLLRGQFSGLVFGCKARLERVRGEGVDEPRIEDKGNYGALDDVHEEKHPLSERAAAIAATEILDGGSRHGTCGENKLKHPRDEQRWVYARRGGDVLGEIEVEPAQQQTRHNQNAAHMWPPHGHKQLALPCHIANLGVLVNGLEVGSGLGRVAEKQHPQRLGTPGGLKA